MSTGMQWTDETWNPVTGCSKVSAGCKHCYAETIANRRLPHGGFTDREFTEVRCHPERLDQPLRWRKPRKVFVNSMSDLFHEDVPEEFVAAVFGVMAASTRHTFQILTKRPARMESFVRSLDKGTEIARCWQYSLETTGRRDFEVWTGARQWPLPNVWLGVSVENQATANERIPLLLQTPAAVRFVSYEPALGPVDFGLPSRLQFGGWPCIDWIIVGGESGPHARPFDVAWARETIRQCREAGVPVFVKQLGAHVHDGVWCGGKDWCRSTERGKHLKFRDRSGGDMNEWPEDLRVREFPR